MKRSTINHAIEQAIELCQNNKIALPGFAYWKMPEWEQNISETGIMREVSQGWDVTDFGSDDFEKTGAVLFTSRNGTLGGAGTPYAEKFLIFSAGQYLPLHFHHSKTEDIINRGVGVMTIRLYQANADDSVNYSDPVDVYCDGRLVTAQAGEQLRITAGNSITLTPRMYHTFGAEKQDGPLIAGEVSSINDDSADNYFAQALKYVSERIEDAPIIYPLNSEYGTLFSK